jgi:hypothetical protein
MLMDFSAKHATTTELKGVSSFKGIMEEKKESRTP